MKEIVRTLLVLVAGFFIFLFGQTIGEHIAIQREIRQFVQRGVLDEVHSTDTIKYYKVSRETYYPDELIRNPFYNNDLTRPGSAGDIFVTQQSPLVGYPGVHEFVTFFFGGHAAVLDSTNRVYETIGIPDSDENLLNVILNGGRNTHVTGGTYNYWLDSTYRNTDPNDPSYRAFGNWYRNEWVGLRIKGVTQADIDEALLFLEDKAIQEAQYNFLFVLNTKNKYYCTDMVSRAYESIQTDSGKQKYNLNRDLIAVTVNDLILSKNTYISYYVTTKHNIKHVYYIG
jgi:hypothetical protein